MIPYDRRFLGNTSIEYNGEYIAIWNVASPLAEDAETLAADLAHEMFHAFQYENQEKRFPNDLLLLAYPDAEENYKTKHYENMLLADACLSEDKKDKRAYLSKFISARKYREGLVGDIINQEYLVESIEGIAEYLGCMTLKQISMDKYLARTNAYADKLRLLNGDFFDIRRMLYYSGALFCILLSEAGVDFYHNVNGAELPLFTCICMCSTGEKPDINFDSSTLFLEIRSSAYRKQCKLDAFLGIHSKRVDGEYEICGYDPMNMTKMGNSILCDNFVILKSENDAAPVFIKGPLLVNLEKGSLNRVISYIV